MLCRPYSRLALFLVALMAALWGLGIQARLAAQPAPTPDVQWQGPPATPVDYSATQEEEPHTTGYEGRKQASTYSQVVFGALLVLILLLMSLELVDKSIVTTLGALLCLGLAYSPWFELLSHAHAGHGQAPFYITTIDWSTIGVIIGTSIFVEIASRSGIFTWSALKLTKVSRGDPFRLLVFYSVLTVLFSAFLNNVTAMIIVGSLTVVSCKRLGLAPLPFLFTEGILTNIGGLLTLISSIPNIIVGNTAGISFLTFFLISAPYTALAAVITVLYARHRFEEIESLAGEEARRKAYETVMEFDENESIQDHSFFKVAWVGMAVVIFGFALQSQLPILRDMGLEAVALGAAAIFLLLYAPHSVEEAVDQVEWSLILFFASLFVIIGVMEVAGVLDAIGDGIKLLLGLGQAGSTAALLWATAFTSSVTDNIPLAAMLARIFKLLGTPSDSVLWWAVIFGGNLGGNLTPIGSASTVVAMTIIRKQDIPFTFGRFVTTALPFALLQLGLASLYLLLMVGLGEHFVGAVWMLSFVALVAFAAIRQAVTRWRRGRLQEAGGAAPQQAGSPPDPASSQVPTTEVASSPADPAEEAGPSAQK